MDILFGEINKTYRFYLKDGSHITITQIGSEVKIHLAENWIIKFKKFTDEITLIIADGGTPYYTSRSKKSAIRLIDDTITRAHGCNPVHNIVVNLLDEIMKPVIPIPIV